MGVTGHRRTIELISVMLFNIYLGMAKTYTNIKQSTVFDLRECLVQPCLHLFMQGHTNVTKMALMIT